jgi:hypothetical protein
MGGGHVHLLAAVGAQIVELLAMEMAASDPT